MNMAVRGLHFGIPSERQLFEVAGVLQLVRFFDHLLALGALDFPVSTLLQVVRHFLSGKGGEPAATVWALGFPCLADLSLV